LRNIKTNISGSNHHTTEAEQSSYRQIFRATSLFGGVQAFNVIFGIIRVKVVAVLLGATGVGIIGLLNAPLQLIITATSLGISMSAVREIAEANSSGNLLRISDTLTAVKRWAWFTGLFGALVTLLLAPFLSKWSFSSQEYTWAFVFLSLSVLFQSISKGQGAKIQGMRKLKYIAVSNVMGTALSLAVSILLYFYYGIKGIVPSLIITALIVLIISTSFSNKIKIPKSFQSPRESFFFGFGMVKLGLFMTLSSIVANASAYILNAYISKKGGVEQVGLYNAGWNLAVQYTGLIFSAMATDYFPRLASINSDIEKVKSLVRQQTEIALIIMTPLLNILILSMPLVIKLIYSPQFNPIILFTNLTLVAMPLKAIAWAINYIYLAKGDGKLFFILEISGAALILTLNIFFYHLWSLEGLAISYFLTNGIIIIINYLIVKIKYSFKFTNSFIGTFISLFALTMASLGATYFIEPITKNLVGITIILISLITSITLLNKYVNLKIAINEIVKSTGLTKFL